MAKKADTQEQAQELQQLKAALKNNQLGSFYIFCGEEAFLKEYYVNLITKKLTDGPAGDFNLHSFTAENLNPQDLRDALDAIPMMAKRSLIRIDDVDFFKQKEELRQRYTEILSDIPETCCVVLYYDTVEYKANGTMKKLAAVMKQASLLNFKKQTERDLAAWVSRHFKAAGKDAPDDVCRYLIFLTDGYMTTLSGEIEKIAAYDTDGIITKGDVDAVAIPALSAQSFDISNAIVAGDYEKALRKLQELFALQTEPIAILGAISAQLRRLLYARTVTGAGKGQAELMELTGIGSYPASLTMTAARRTTDSFCRFAADACLQTDLAMKTGGGDPKELLEILITQLAQEARNGSHETGRRGGRPVR